MGSYHGIIFNATEKEGKAKMSEQDKNNVEKVENAQVEDTKKLIAMGIKLNVQQTPSHKMETMEL